MANRIRFRAQLEGAFKCSQATYAPVLMRSPALSTSTSTFNVRDAGSIESELRNNRAQNVSSGNSSSVSFALASFNAALESTSGTATKTRILFTAAMRRCVPVRAARCTRIDKRADIGVSRSDDSGEWGIDLLERLQLLAEHIGRHGIDRRLLGAQIAHCLIRSLFETLFVLSRF